MTKHLRQAIIDTLGTLGPLLRECERQGATNLGFVNNVDKKMIDDCRQPYDDLAYHFMKECKKHGKFSMKVKPHA